VIYLDTETYSPVDIGFGVDAYSEQAEVLLLPYAIDDEPVQVWDVVNDEDPSVLPLDLWNALDRGDAVVMHNSYFDRTILRKALRVTIPPEQIIDTMALAALHSLPLHLGQLGEALGLPEERAKIKDGKRLIQLFCKPQPASRKVHRATRETHPEQWARFVEYARRDVEAMREVYQRMPRWNDTPAERAVWLADQAINDRGFAVDLELAAAATRTVDRERERLNARVEEITKGRITSVTQRDELMHELRGHGLYLPNLQASTVDDALRDPAVTGVVRELLEARAQAGSTSVQKYQVVSDASVGGRLRGTLQYCGATRTGRWAGRLLNPQNQPRPTLKAADVDAGIEAMRLDCADLLFANVYELAVSAVRGMIVAPPGSKLVVADFSAIEGRVLAWLAGEDWKVEAYREGQDLYKLAYHKAFGVPLDQVTKEKRQVGKVMELAFGYQGAVGAWATMGRNYGLAELVDRGALRVAWLDRAGQTEETFEAFVAEQNKDAVLDLVRRWRQSNSAIVALWSALDEAARATLADGVSRKVGRLEFSRVEHLGVPWLLLQLPSGRHLCYCNARVDYDHEAGSHRLTYLGVHQLTRSWRRLSTYGGKWAEQATQATSRDLLADAILACEGHDYPIVLHVHDEALAEVLDGPAHSLDEMIRLMVTASPWATGLPLNAAGFETYRYRKE